MLWFSTNHKKMNSNPVPLGSLTHLTVCGWPGVSISQLFICSRVCLCLNRPGWLELRDRSLFSASHTWLPWQHLESTEMNEWIHFKRCARLASSTQRNAYRHRDRLISEEMTERVTVKWAAVRRHRFTQFKAEIELEYKQSSLNIFMLV